MFSLGLKRGSATARLLGCGFESVSCECCLLSVSATRRLLVQRTPTDCDRGTSQRRPRSTRPVEP